MIKMQLAHTHAVYTYLDNLRAMTHEQDDIYLKIPYVIHTCRKHIELNSKRGEQILIIVHLVYFHIYLQ